MNKKSTWTLVAFFSLLLSGCATIGSLRPGDGTSFEITNKSYDQVWKAAITVVGRSLTIVESDKQTGVIKAEKGAGLATWGEVVGVFIKPANTDSKRFTVVVESKKRVLFQITGQNWERTIIEGIKAELDL